jgi:hypothetical protein
MNLRNTLLAILAMASLAHNAFTPPIPTGEPLTESQVETGLKAFDGEWTFVEDQTEGRTLEQLNPPMSITFSIQTEPNAVILTDGHGSGHKNVRIAFDGTPTEVPGTTEGTLARYKASWNNNILKYEVEFIRAAGQAPTGQIIREFQFTKDGLIVRSNLMLTAGIWSVGLYRHPEDIPMPTPVPAKIDALSWLVGDWVGSRGTNGSIQMEERWSMAKGGSMLAVSRTVSKERMTAFEYLRIVERDGGLIYIAQPNGSPPTEFVMTELSSKHAVFVNPRHDYPRRIQYQLQDDGGLVATIGQLKGGTPRKFEFKRE